MAEINNERPIGDYTKLKNSTIQVGEEARQHMLTLLEDLYRLKSYKEETFYLACSLADRYLNLKAASQEKAPCLIHLAIVCTLLAGKLE